MSLLVNDLLFFILPLQFVIQNNDDDHQELRVEKEDFRYEPHTVLIRSHETRDYPYLKINPNGKIPSLVDHDNIIFESGACLMYLAEKYHELLPVDHCPERYDVLKWLFFGSTNVSGQFKKFGFYYKYCTHDLPYVVDRYALEVNRLLGVIETQLASHDKHWICGDLYSIADLSIWPWLHALHTNYDDCIEKRFHNMAPYPKSLEWYSRVHNRPAIQKALEVTTFVA